jgi:cell volume regulation protein A
MDILTILTSTAILLLIGIIITMISAKIKLPSMLLLLIVGIISGSILYKEFHISLPEALITGIGTFALIIILFDACAKLNLREMEKYSFPALKLAIIFLILNVIALTTATYFIYGTTIQLALVFAVLMSGTSPDAILSILHTTKNKAVEILDVESIITTPLTLLLPFMIINFETATQGVIKQTFNQITSFLIQILVGIGAGILVGIIIFKVLRRTYSEKLTPLAIITAALLTYVLAENLQGNGVIAVTTLGLFFGSLHLKNKVTLLGLESNLSNILKIIVFILLGIIIKMPLTVTFFMQAIALFAIYLIIRFATIQIIIKDKHSLRQKIFMTLTSPKGIGAGAAILFLTTYIISGLSQILSLAIAFVVISLLTASITAMFSKYFIKEEIK